MNYTQEDSPRVTCGKFGDFETMQKSQQQSDEGTCDTDKYSAQCAEFFKWRLIPTEEEFEEIRSTLLEKPFVCNCKQNTNCDDPADIEHIDASQTWVIEKPGIPKSPKGFKRKLVFRKDYSRMDPYFYTPTGKRLKGPAQVAAYLESNPDIKDVSVSDFHFTCPKIMKSTMHS
ncbi:hypothetical protein QQ045_009987 [Rhodiola kirilowii]